MAPCCQPAIIVHADVPAVASWPARRVRAPVARRQYFPRKRVLGIDGQGPLQLLLGLGILPFCPKNQRQIEVRFINRVVVRGAADRGSMLQTPLYRTGRPKHARFEQDVSREYDVYTGGSRCDAPYSSRFSLTLL
jgi:hypothetical protein